MRCQSTLCLVVFLSLSPVFVSRCSPSNSRVAEETYQRALDGDPEAQYSLGRSYARGEGVEWDLKEAAKLLRLAAEQNYAKGQSHLGAMYGLGYGVPQDNVQAHLWFNLANAGGVSYAREARDQLAEEMTPEQIKEAQALAHEWKRRSRFETQSVKTRSSTGRGLDKECLTSLAMNNSCPRLNLPEEAIQRHLTCHPNPSRGSVRNGRGVPFLRLTRWTVHPVADV